MSEPYKLTLIITRGLPASGKSTWARKQEGFTIVEKDEIRKELETYGGWKWSRENEKDVLRVQEQTIRTLLKNGHSVIAADTNFGKHEERLKKLALSCGADFAVRDFTDVPLDTCLQRNKLRVGRKEKPPVPDDFIIEQYHKYVYPFQAVEKVKNDPTLPWCVISDLDGTIADHNGARSPYDTAKCEQDLPKKNIIFVLETLANVRTGIKPIFVTGREEKFRDVTEAWLGHIHPGWQNERLLMRKTGDHRNDAIVKNEIFNEHIRGQYYVLCVLDDRDRVVKRWRELGLTCLQVDYGNF